MSPEEAEEAAERRRTAIIEEIIEEDDAVRCSTSFGSCPQLFCLCLLPAVLLRKIAEGVAVGLHA